MDEGVLPLNGASSNRGPVTPTSYEVLTVRRWIGKENFKRKEGVGTSRDLPRYI